MSHSYSNNSIADMVGNRYGYVVVKGVEKFNNTITLLVCACDCGRKFKISHRYISDGTIKSCGCIRIRNKIRYINRKTVSKYTDHKLYTAWSNMKARCCRKSDRAYYRYGGRGISVCREWMYSFENFKEFALENGWEPGLEMDRIDNDGNYEPDNVRFVTRMINAQNRPDVNLVVIGGFEFHGINEVARRMNKTAYEVRKLADKYPDKIKIISRNGADCRGAGR